MRVYSGTSLRRTEVVTDPSYRYTLDKNAADGLKRSIKFVVRTINTMNQTGSATATVTVVNSQIAAPIDVVVNVDYDTFYASTFKPIELDYNGTQFHMSKTKGFTPSSSSLVADVRDNTFSKSLSVGKWYCRIGHYDVFDKTGINFSAEKEVVLTEVTLADIDVDGIIAGINESLQNEAVERARVDIQNAQDALLLVTQEASDRAAAIQAETVARTNAVAKEASDRATAITTAVASETSARNTAITAEATTRANAITAEASARHDALIAEASARGTAISNEAKSRSDADSALSSRVDIISAATGSNAAAITAEATARTNADSALSTRVDSVLAKSNANSASISSEVTARTNADSALSTRVDSVLAKSDANSASITSLTKTVTDNNSATATRIDTVEATALTQAQAAETSAKTFATASVNTEKNARITADSALTTRIDTVTATADKNKADIVTVNTALTTKEAALASSINTVQANVDSVDGKLTTEKTARTTADTALSTRIDTVTATANKNKADIVTVNTAFANADTALSTRIDTVTATANKNKADIVTVNTALTTKEAALAQSITNVQANVDGVDGKLTTEKTARTSADTALSTRIDTVTATANKNKADIVTVNTALADANTAFASSLTSMETAVKADATTKADAAKAAALVAAATDASTKANNALAAAKTDATTKANSAESNAKVAAATDAAAKAAQALVDAKSYADTKKTEAATYTNSKYDAAVSLINQKDSAQATALTNMETSVKTDSTNKANQALNDALAQSGGTNLLNISTFTSNANKGGWSSGSVVAINSVTGVSALDGRTHALMLSTRDNYEYQNPIPVVAGETIYWGAWINTQATSNRVNFGYRKYANGVAQNSWITSTFLNGNTGWTWVQGSQVMHADATSIVPFLQISASSNYGSPLVQDIVISRSPVRAGALAAKDSLSASDVGADPAGSAAAAQQAAQTYSNGKYDQAVTLINQKDTAQSTKTSTLEAAVGYSLSEINNQETNFDFKRGTLNWSAGEVVNDAEVGKCLEVTGDVWPYNSVFIPVDPSKTYRLTAKIKQQTISGNKNSYLGVRTYDANYNELTGGAGTYRYCGKAGGDTPNTWTTFTGEITGTGTASHNQFRAGTCYIQVMAIGNYNGGSGKCRFADFKFEDVTEQLAVNAKITTVENALATKDSAMATRVTNMETSLKTDATNKANTAETNAKNAAATYTNTKYNDAVTLINNKDSAQTSALTSMETSLKTDSTNKVNAASEIASSIYNLIPDAGFEKPFVNGVPVGFDSVGSGTISSVNKTSRLESDGWGLDYGGFTGDINQGAPQGTNPDLYYDTFTLPVSVTLGQRLGFSIYTGAHRCKTAAFIYFYNSAGAVVTNSPLDYNYNVLNGGNSLSGYKRLVSYRDVPAGAVYAKGVVRKYNTDQGQSSSYLFYVMPQLSMWGSNQTTPPTWCNTARVDAAIAGADPVGSAAAAQAAAATYTNSKYDQAVTLISNKDSAQTTALTAMEASVRNEINSRGNLLQKYMDNWKIGKHPLDCGMYINGSTDENRFVLGDDPYGSKSVLWEMNTNSSANSDGDGGIGSAVFACDSKKSYRYTLYVYKTATGGTTFFGCSGGGPTLNLTGSLNTNPYFWAGGLANNKWYLMVGVLQPDTGTVDSGVSGLYDCETGVKVASGTDYKMTAGATSQHLRAYLYYSTNPAAKQYFWNPRVDVIDGNEPSLSSLMPNVATNALSKYTEVVDLVTAKDSAMATRVDGLTTTVGNNTSSVNTLSSSVNGLRAEYTVKVNSVGHVAGIGLSSGPMGSAFIAQADRIVLANSTGGSGVAPFKLVNNVVYLNTAVIQNASITTAHVGQLEASNIKAGAINATHILGDTITGDKIKAGTKISSPIIEGGQVRLLGTNYMEISSATPFGPDSLVKWCGAKLMSGSEPNFAALRKSNATQYVTANGDAYFGGALSAGILKNGLDTTLLTPYTVGSYMNEVGPFSSNGKAKNVVVSYQLGAVYSGTSAATNPTQPKLQWQLERSINSGSWVTVSSGTFNGTTTAEYDNETRRWLTDERCNGSSTFTDNTTTTGTYAYRIKVLAYSRFHSTANVTSQILTVISTEQ
ncbi:DUF1983 domain-containing protein [Shewanella inventionis]|uniref:DUF1983 domain-containing protein n=1 Tax=Shewanella inventionis TaxID=1738770 RepID=UPI001CBFF59C|nr:DUF1983 domain-containing protein [Shewanella inventionis]UAL42839.1 DUF1983 domain-containing protein [Shewanella inventionis]